MIPSPNSSAVPNTPRIIENSAPTPIFGPMLPLQHEREHRQHATLAPVVGLEDEVRYLHDDEDERPEHQREDAVHVRGVRRHAVLRRERLPHRVQRARADVTVDDAERREREDGESLAYRVRRRMAVAIG